MPNLKAQGEGSILAASTKQKTTNTVVFSFNVTIIDTIDRRTRNSKSCALIRAPL